MVTAVHPTRLAATDGAVSDLESLSGPELSAAVAREVMWWEEGKPIVRKTREGTTQYMGGWSQVAHHWQPHERIEHAMEVVELLQEYGEHGCAVELETLVLEDGKIGWGACFILRGEGVFREDAHRLAEAICHAALAVVREHATAPPPPDQSESPD